VQAKGEVLMFPRIGGVFRPRQGRTGRSQRRFLHRLYEMNVVAQALEAEEVLQDSPSCTPLVRDTGDHAAQENR
jgi:hypothetical protein